MKSSYESTSLWLLLLGLLKLDLFSERELFLLEFLVWSFVEAFVSSILSFDIFLALSFSYYSRLPALLGLNLLEWIDFELLSFILF